MCLAFVASRSFKVSLHAHHVLIQPHILQHIIHSVIRSFTTQNHSRTELSYDTTPLQQSTATENGDSTRVTASSSFFVSHKKKQKMPSPCYVNQ